MKSLHSSQRGASFVVVAVAIVVIAVIGLIAYKVRSNNLSSSNSGQTNVVTEPKTIDSKADLRAAKNALQTAPIGSDLDPDQLDKSINSLL